MYLDPDTAEASFSLESHSRQVLHCVKVERISLVEPYSYLVRYSGSKWYLYMNHSRHSLQPHRSQQRFLVYFTCLGCWTSSDIPR